jgi:DNA-binding GntR family transcriptional regulator
MKSAPRLFRDRAMRTAAGGARGESTSRSELVYRKLRDAIASGALKPGQRLMETEVAEWLEVSRTPVREALRRLEGDGMLTVEPRMGRVVASISRQAMLELYVMREVLEGTAARLCARHASETEIIELQALVEREARLRGNLPEAARHNRLFHDAIHRGAHNRYLEKSLAAVNDTMHLLGPSQLLIPERARQSQAEHAQLLAHIRSHDAEGAEAAARRHVRSAQQQRLQNLFPDA